MTRPDDQFTTYWLILVVAVLIASGFMLGGCATVPGEAKSLKPVCDVLGPPARLQRQEQGQSLARWPEGGASPAPR